jgi:hypothetical protein
MSLFERSVICHVMVSFHVPYPDILLDMPVEQMAASASPDVFVIFLDFNAKFVDSMLVLPFFFFY